MVLGSTTSLPNSILIMLVEDGIIKMDQEIWEDISEYEGLYKISNYGRVRSVGRYVTQKYHNNGKEYYRSSLRSQRLLAMCYNRQGYLLVELSKDKNKKKYQAHRLVAEAFIPNPENKPQVNHKNGVKDDNRASNLEWVTCSENNIKKFTENGVKPYGCCGKNNVPIICVESGVEYPSILECSRDTGLTRYTIYRSLETGRMVGNKMHFKYK